ncbi:MAG: hypothetical protein V4436_02015 [Patescibacteria group bacterium]
MNDESKIVAIDGEDFPVWVPTMKEALAVTETIKTFEKGRDNLNRGYNYFGGRNLTETIDDWTKRWNGYIPPMSPLLDNTQSNIFINFTRNAIIGYLSKVAMSPVKAHIIAVNKKNGMSDQKIADLFEDLNQYSLNAENAPKKFMEAAIECVTKGTVVVYEGYMRTEQEMKTPIKFDQTTGEIEYKKEKRVLFDNCYQQVVPLEDFYILNPFEPEIQKQPKVIWRKITSRSEAETEFEHYKNWEYVRPGNYTIASEVMTFYRNTLMSELLPDQVEILRYYCKIKNRHMVIVNGVLLYDGPIPFKDGDYPFAKTINEPFAVDFFYGNGSPNKYMGEQDLINTFINAMADKTINSLTVTGLSSDLDDVIEDDVLEVGKFRKVGDIDKWKWWEAPAVNTGEMNMFNQVMSLARESGSTDAGQLTTPRGGKVQTRQVLLKQQELMQKLSFNMNFLEDLERDRTKLRLSHILQFYSIPKIEKITGKKGKEIEKLLYRDVQLSGVKLSDGRTGDKIIHLIDGTSIKNPDDRATLEDELSLIEVKGDLRGTPTEALALSVDVFNDYNHSVQVVKYSSYEKNQALDQASRMEFANWRIQLAQLVPIKNAQGLIDWVEESFDVDTEQFEQAPMGAGGQPAPPPTAPGAGGPAGGSGQPQALKQNAPSAIGQNASENM